MNRPVLASVGAGFFVLAVALWIAAKLDHCFTAARPPSLSNPAAFHSFAPERCLSPTFAALALIQSLRHELKTEKLVVEFGAD